MFIQCTHDKTLLVVYLQVKFNPRNVSGFGLSDGEVCECLWSFLRWFATMTKEIRPAHRVDVLTDALCYYARKSAGGLSMFTVITHSTDRIIFVHTSIDHRLLKKMKHTLKVKQEATEDLQYL